MAVKVGEVAPAPKGAALTLSRRAEARYLCFERLGATDPVEQCSCREQFVPTARLRHETGQRLRFAATVTSNVGLLVT